VDVKGNIYLASRSLKRPGVLVINPDGEEVAFIPTGKSQPGSKKPEGIPSNVCFGIGKESKVLYITVDTSLYRIPLKVKGWHIPWERNNN
jgi:sugar lactone lactonase YvrE